MVVIGGRKNMRRKLNIIYNLLIIFCLISSIYAQKRDIILDFHQNEQLNWQQHIYNARLFDDNSNFNVLFYYLDIEIDVESPYIRGSVLCRFRSEIDGLTDIKLNLHNSLSIDSIKGNISDYEIVDDTIMINLSQAIAFESVDEIIIHYQGIPELAYGYKGLRYEFHGNREPIIATLSTPYLAHYWWPCKDGPGDKADSVYIDITIPDTVINDLPILAVSNGLLENTLINNGKKTFQWRERYPIVPYYVMVAISNYSYIKQDYTGIDDQTYFNEYFVFDEHLEEANDGIEDLPEAINLFSNYFGEYPFKREKYGMTQLGYYGAIENQTNTIINNMSLDWMWIIVHELAHMWFGDMITCKTWNHGWLNEGFATYCEALWVEYKDGVEAYKEYISYFEYYGGGSLYLEDDTDPLNIFVPIIYEKGAYTLHMLRGVLGDSLFFLGLKNYASDPKFMYGHATTEDFIHICEETSHQELKWFFDQWIYGEYYPYYSYSWKMKEVEGLYQIQLGIDQIQENGGLYKMPIDVKVTTDTSDTVIVVWDSLATQIFEIFIDAKPLDVELDPSDWILKRVEKQLLPPYAENIKVNSSYQAPGIDTLVVTSGTNNPEYHQLELEMTIESEDRSISDTISMYDDGKHEDGASGDGVFGAYWPVPSGENFYTVSIKTLSLENGYFYILNESAHFTTKGPLVLDYYEIVSEDSVANPGDFIGFEFHILNKGVTDSLYNISSKLISLDSCAQVVGLTDPIYGDIAPGETSLASRPVRVLFDSDCSAPATYEFILEIYTEYRKLWQDTIVIDVVSGLAYRRSYLPIEYALKQNYPNPFNPKTVINYQLPMTSDVKLDVYNLLGQKVTTLVSERMEAGYYQVEWDASGFSSGIYFYKIQAGMFNEVRKMILLR